MISDNDKPNLACANKIGYWGHPDLPIVGSPPSIFRIGNCLTRLQGWPGDGHG